MVVVVLVAVKNITLIAKMHTHESSSGSFWNGSKAGVGYASIVVVT